MNANELADALDDVVANYIQMIADVDFSDVATMLRQQQAELDRAVELYTDKAIENEALKQIIDANNLNQNIGQFVKPTNKPVAWMIDTLDGKHLMLYGSNPPPVFNSEVNSIPLYTHPVKELTDEEIIEIGLLTTDPRFSHIESPLLLEFARAILRKAQENDN